MKKIIILSFTTCTLLIVAITMSCNIFGTPSTPNTPNPTVLKQVITNDGKSVTLQFSENIGRFVLGDTPAEDKIKFYTGTTLADAKDPTRRMRIEINKDSFIFNREKLYFALNTALVKNQYLTVILEPGAVDSSTLDMPNEYTETTSIIQSRAPEFVTLYLYPTKYIVVYNEIVAAKDLTTVRVYKNNTLLINNTDVTIQAASSESIVGHVEGVTASKNFINFGICNNIYYGSCSRRYHSY